MAEIQLANLASRQLFFQQRIQALIDYWQTWLAENDAPHTALQAEQDNILKAILFALNDDSAWPSAYEVIISFSPCMERQGEWERWGSILDKAVQSAKRVHDIDKAGQLSVSLGLMYQRQGRFKQAIHHYRNAIHLNNHLKTNMTMGRAYTNLGYLFTELGYWYRAEILCCHALDIFAKINSVYGCAHTHNHLGLLYTRQHRWDLAQQHLGQACQLWQDNKDDYGLMRGYLNLGVLYLQKKSAVTALNYLHKALNKAQQTGDRTLEGGILANTGIAYRLQGDFKEAEKYLKQAEIIFKADTDYLELARVWHSLGMVYYCQDEWDKAIDYLDTAVTTWRQLNNTKDRLDTLADVIECELARKNFEQAAIRLDEIEMLMGDNESGKAYKHLNPRLKKYRSLLRR